MGGSGGGGGGGGPTKPRCDGPFTFYVIIINNHQQIWNTVNIRDKVYISTSGKSPLPRLEVKREIDDFLIGLVSTEYTGLLLRCIENHWNYDGEVTEKDGNVNNPQIQVTIEG